MKTKTRLTAVLAAVMAASGATFERESRFARYNSPAPRPCLNCGKPHNHNNSFCSADCCRYYRGKP